ncbi:MAG: metallophosphoesterase [Verrucomicrobiales bacterium]|nr:metallophosphoesterase [Verrucomicrobiales bacterium]
MKCLLTADLHYALPQLDWVRAVAGRFDLVVLAGDLLDLASLVEDDIQTLVVMKYLQRISAESRLLVSSGNHDCIERSAGNEAVATWLAAAREQGVLVDGDAFQQDGVLFTICPWWDGPETAGALAGLLERDAAREKRRWIWVYHAPPDQTRVSWTGKGYFGDGLLLDHARRYAPDLVLGGHVHQAPFRAGGGWVDRRDRTWFFNAGRQIGPEPAFVVLDLEAWNATWISQAGRAFLDLSAPWDPEHPPPTE